MSMRVGIYNRWLATLGGGEKYSLMVAEYLSRQHSVTVISHKQVSKELAARRLNCDLSRVDFLCIPERPAAEITPLTTEYDFFINASFLDLFPSRAPCSALLIFFPTPLHLERTYRLRRRIALVLKQLLHVPTFADGVLSTRVVNGSQYRETASVVKIKLPPSRNKYCLSFDIAAGDPEVRQALICLDDQPLQVIDLALGSSFTRRSVVVPASDHNRFRDLVIQARIADDRLDGPYDKMALTRIEIDDPRYRLYQLLFERWLKDLGLQMHRVSSNMSPLLESVDSYDAIWAISAFTQRWIRRYWNRPSAILYPPVDVDDFRPVQKRNQILTVGRFFAESHNKKHREMVSAFKEMVGHGLRGWEFHLAGGTGWREVDQKYLQELYELSKGYPIIIHADIPFQDLVKLYGESAIYWHASGLGEDENREPIKFEHFGITTVEAMASGCVPVVIGKGGQPEIVKHDRNGFLWNTTAELKKLTWKLIRDAPLRQRLADAAMRNSRLYGKAQFSSNLQELLSQIGLAA